MQALVKNLHDVQVMKKIMLILLTKISESR